MDGQRGRPSAPADASSAPLSTADEALLFRYFDFTVEPGKQYRYRVKLWVANPNFGVEPSQLNDEARKLRDELLKKKTGEKFVLSPESKPSDPIYVPYDGVLVAGKWSPPTPAQEPSVSVGVEQWTANDGATAQFLKGKVYRGQLVNFEVTPAGDGPGAQQPGAAVLEIGDNIPKRNELPIPFRTEVAVLDMAPAPPDGGAAAKEQPPADILVLDAAGRLRLYTAKEMAEQFQQIADNFGQVNVKPDKEESGRNNSDALSRPPGLGPSSLGSGLGGSSLGKPRPGANPK